MKHVYHAEDVVNFCEQFRSALPPLAYVFTMFQVVDPTSHNWDLGCNLRYSPSNNKYLVLIGFFMGPRVLP